MVFKVLKISSIYWTNDGKVILNFFMRAMTSFSLFIHIIYLLKYTMWIKIGMFIIRMMWYWWRMLLRWRVILVSNFISSIFFMLGLVSSKIFMLIFFVIAIFISLLFKFFFMIFFKSSSKIIFFYSFRAVSFSLLLVYVISWRKSSSISLLKSLCSSFL